jgi:glycosyltransferase involved in cell wall biosynthesis
MKNEDKMISVDVISFKKKNKDCALLIPVFNEEERIVNQLSKINENDLVDIYIVDGGSTDSTVERLAEFQNLLTGILVVNNSSGLSHQLRVGFDKALSLEYKYVITMDGNDKDDFDGVGQIKKALEQGYDFVQGSRFIPGGRAINTPIKRLLGIRLIHAPLTSLFAGKKFTDTTNGFRGHSRKLLEQIQFDREIFRTYELLAYIPIRAGKLKLKCIEMPVTRKYPTGTIPTKINSFRAEIRLLKILFYAGIGKYD